MGFSPKNALGPRLTCGQKARWESYRHEPVLELDKLARRILGRRYLGLPHDAKEGAIRILEHNEVRSIMIPPGISSRSQCHQTINFGLLVRGVKVEMKPTPAPRARIATLE